MAVVVRDIEPGDFEVAGKVVLAAYRALPGSHLSGGYADELIDVARRAVEALVLVAVDPEVIGCVTYVPDLSSPYAEMLRPGEASMRMLAVDPRAQGRGIGDALVRACVERARSEERRALILHSTPWMQAAHRLYLRSGFVRVPERDFRPVPEVPLLAFEMQLRNV